MKTKYIILAAALICSTASFAQKTKFNNELNQGLSNSGQQISGTIEEELRDKLMPVLRQVGSVSNLRYYGNTADKSVDFKYKNKDYWYSAEKSSNGVVELLLTRNGRKMYSDDNKKMYNEDAVLQAINEVNNKYFSVKMYYDRSKGSIRICQQTFVKSTSSITPEAVIRSLDEMDNAWQYYERTYLEISGDEKIVDNPEEPGNGVVFQQKSVSKLSVQNVIFESVDGNDNKIADIENGRIAHNKMQFIRPIIVCSALEADKYILDVKIFNDKGLMLQYEDTPNFTISGPVDIKKKEKTVDASVGTFGSPDFNDWAKGTYKVEVYEGESLLHTSTFTIY